MKVQVLHPYGYCYGVIHAIELAKKPKRNILLSMFRF